MCSGLLRFAATFSAISEIQVEHVAGFFSTELSSQRKKKKREKKVMREGGSTRVFMKPTRFVDKQTAAISKVPLSVTTVSSLSVSSPEKRIFYTQGSWRVQYCRLAPFLALVVVSFQWCGQSDIRGLHFSPWLQKTLKSLQWVKNQNFKV